MVRNQPARWLFHIRFHQTSCSQRDQGQCEWSALRFMAPSPPRLSRFMVSACRYDEARGVFSMPPDRRGARRHGAPAASNASALSSSYSETKPFVSLIFTSANTAAVSPWSRSRRPSRRTCAVLHRHFGGILHGHSRCVAHASDILASKRRRAMSNADLPAYGVAS